MAIPLTMSTAFFCKLYNNYSDLIIRYYNTVFLPWTNMQAPAHVGTLSLAGDPQKTASCRWIRFDPVLTLPQEIGYRPRNPRHAISFCDPPGCLGGNLYPNFKQTVQSQPVVRRDVEGTSRCAGRNRPRHRNQGCYPCGERLGFLGGSRSQRIAYHCK